jgi:hypothetical protein
MKKYILITISIYLTSLSYAQTINVTDFGVQPNTFADATEGVQKAIDKCKNTPGATLSFPKGRYDFWPDKAMQKEFFISNTSTEEECPSKIKKIGVLLEGLNDITIEGNGSVFIYHGKMITWAIDNCKNIRICNLSVDFERPSMTELTIEELYPDQMIATIHSDSKYAIMDGKIRFYGEGWGMNSHYFSILTDTIKGTNQYISWDPIKDAKATEIAPFKIEFENDFSNANYEVDQTITIRDHIRDHVGIFVNQSKNVTLDNLNLHYMHGLGVISQFSENLNYQKVNIVPARGRTIAAFADGMHFSGCKGHIEIKDCHFKGLHDDPINVHGTYLKINKIISPDKLVMRFMHGQTYGMQPFFENDSVAFIQSRTLQKVNFATVKTVKRISDREVQLELDKPLPDNMGEGDCIENVSCTPSLHVSNCRMEMTNTRGLLVSTPRKVVIENNYFYRTGMHAILIAADANSWYESGAVSDVTIRNNIFDGCGYNNYYDNNSYVIAIEPENHERVKKHWVHHNIRVQGNIFKIYDDNLILKAKSTVSLYFGNNTIEKSDFIPDFKGRNKKRENNFSFRFDDCSRVKIENNNYKVGISDIKIGCNNMVKKDIVTDKKLTLSFSE